MLSKIFFSLAGLLVGMPIGMLLLVVLVEKHYHCSIRKK
jgi:hypothetical protein